MSWSFLAIGYQTWKVYNCLAVATKTCDKTQELPLEEWLCPQNLGVWLTIYLALLATDSTLLAWHSQPLIPHSLSATNTTVLAWYSQPLIPHSLSATNTTLLAWHSH
jgi:hypothetical protein